MANRSQFGSPPATGGSGGIGNVVGPSSAVNNNLAAFDTTTGKLLEDSGIATSQVATSQTAATAVARLALTGLARGARVYQTDNGFWYELTNAAAPSDAASWQGIPKKYVALLTQTGTDAPVATVLENSLGGTVVWSYNGVGAYRAILSGAFPSDKVNVQIANGTFSVPVFVSKNTSTADRFDIAVVDVSASSAEWEVTGASICVLVYP